MNPEGEFSHDIKKLIQLLKKIMKHHPMQEKISELEKQSSREINLNVFVFPLLPLSAEDVDELGEICESAIFEGEKDLEELRYKLNPSDLEFLRRHGIRF